MLLQMILERTNGKSYIELVGEFWRQLGPEHDAAITLDPIGTPLCCYGPAVTARDWARWGQMVCDYGRVGSGHSGILVLPWSQRCRSIFRFHSCHSCYCTELLPLAPVPLLFGIHSNHGVQSTILRGHRYLGMVKELAKDALIEFAKCVPRMGQFAWGARD